MAAVAYTPACNRTAELLARLGAGDAEIAQVLGISVRTLRRWVKEHAELAVALQKGRVLADAKVAAALYKRAVGYSVKTVKVFQYQGQPVLVDVVEKYPPDTAAAFLWLKNRQPALWRDKPVPVDAAESQPVGIEVVVRDASEA